MPNGEDEDDKMGFEKFFSLCAISDRDEAATIWKELPPKSRRTFLCLAYADERRAPPPPPEQATDEEEALKDLLIESPRSTTSADLEPLDATEGNERPANRAGVSLSWQQRLRDSEDDVDSPQHPHEWIHSPVQQAGMKASSRPAAGTDVHAGRRMSPEPGCVPKPRPQAAKTIPIQRGNPYQDKPRLGSPWRATAKQRRREGEKAESKPEEIPMSDDCVHSLTQKLLALRKDGAEPSDDQILAAVDRWYVDDVRKERRQTDHALQRTCNDLLQRRTRIGTAGQGAPRGSRPPQRSPNHTAT